MTGKGKGKNTVDRVISQKHINKKEVLDQLRSKVSLAQYFVPGSALLKKG